MTRGGALTLAAGLVAAVAVIVQPAFAAVSITSSITSGTPGNNGWYVSDVTVSIQTPGAIQSNCWTVYTFHSSSDTYQCSATDGTATPTLSLQFKIDKDHPAVTGASADRAPNRNGWYDAPVTVTFAGTDATSGIASCTQTTYGGPDGGGAALTGTCTDVAGNVSAPYTFDLKYDSTPPAVTAALARPPDAHGWYNHPVALTVTGTDALSGIASCSGGTYSGPASGSASLTATCTDKAGNTSSKLVTFKYDATPPQLTNVTVASGNTTATIRWTAPADATSVTVQRMPGPYGGLATVYRGDGRSFTDLKLRNGTRYRYVLSVTDQAGKVGKATVIAEPRALTAPAQGETVKEPPLLRWSAVAGADYYNVQLYLADHKVLSTWPIGTTFKLQKTWTYGGHTYTFAKGRYRWYVWPGYGPRKAATYGKLLGASVFAAA